MRRISPPAGSHRGTGGPSVSPPASGASPRLRRGLAALTAVAVLPVGAGMADAQTGSPAPTPPTVTSRVSVGSGGAQARGGGPSVIESVATSADGSVIAFVSNATNLVPGDANGVFDVFIYEVVSGHTTRISVASDGSEATAPSQDVALSADGKVVAFVSAAANLVPYDTNGQKDVFVRDRQSGTTTRVSMATGGTEATAASGQPALSADGRWVAFSSAAGELAPGDANGVSDVFLHDRVGAITTRVSVDSAGGDPDGPSVAPDLSADGTVVAFESRATDLLQGGADGNNLADVFVAAGGAISRVDVGAPVPQGGDSGAPSLSPDGRYVAYTSAATNIAPPDPYPGTDVFVYDRTAGTTRRVSLAGPNGAPDGASHSADVLAAGTHLLVAFASDATNLVPGDTNEAPDAFVRDVSTDTTTRESVDAAGGEAAGASAAPQLAADGGLATFVSNAQNLTVTPGAPGTAEIYRRDRVSGALERVSGPGGGGVADGAEGSVSPALSAGGNVVAFSSQSPDLVPGDTNRTADIFLHDRHEGTTARVSVGNVGEQGNAGSTDPAISADGRWVAFASEASNLVAGDSNGVSDVFLRDVRQGRTTRIPRPTDAESGPACQPAISGDGTTVAYVVHNGGDCVEEGTAAAVFVYRQGTTTLVSVAPDGSPGDGPSWEPALSGDGLTVAFSSDAANLVVDDSNGVTDVFLAKLGTGVDPAVSRVSVGSDGVQADGPSASPSLSADGAHVAFASEADDLVPGDSNDDVEVFIRDLAPKTTTRIEPLPAEGAAGEPALSADGLSVAFTFEPDLPSAGGTRATAVLRHDRLTGAIVTVSVGPAGVAGDSSSFSPAISIDGAVVAFASQAANLVAGDTNGVGDVFVADRHPGAGAGYWLVASDGGVFAFGAPFFGSTGNMKLNRPIVGGSPSPTGAGYWFVASDGGIFSFGDAAFFGSTGDQRLNKPIVGMAATPSGRGYWLVASDGGIFSFGDAAFFGSTGDLRLNKPIVGMAATPTGRGYWLVASDGGIFSFGDARFFGSTGDTKLNKPIVGMAPAPTGKGYWLVAADGGMFSFGDAGFFGSTGAVILNQPIVGMARTPSGLGYWLVASDGGIFSFGDARFAGSTGKLKLNAPIVSLVPR
jgi:Tol biopolymer transport system component